MALSLLFLGKLEDVAGVGAMAIAVDAPLSLREIAGRLDSELARAIGAPAIRIALNGQLVAPDAVRAGDGDELAFLPPVSGG